MDIFSEYFDMKFTDKNVSDMIVDFVINYYEEDYLTDYGDYMGDKALSTSFSWDDYLGFEPIIDKAFAEFCG